MGSRLSLFMSDIFLQESEEVILKKLKVKHGIFLYARYINTSNNK